MNTTKELRLLTSAIITVKAQQADSIVDQIDRLERLRTLEHCLLVALNQYLNRRKK